MILEKESSSWCLGHRRLATGGGRSQLVRPVSNTSNTFHILASVHDVYEKYTLQFSQICLAIGTNMLCSQLRPVSNTSNTSALPYSHQHASCICRRRTNTLCNLNKSILQFRQISFKIGSQQYKQNVGCFIFLPACILHDMIYRRRTTTNIKQTRSGKKT